MIEQRAQELVVGSLAASAAVAAGSALANGHAPGARMVVGVGFAGVGLATLSMFAPDLAGSFAVLILTTTLIVSSAPLLAAVSSFTAPSTPPPAH